MAFLLNSKADGPATPDSVARRRKVADAYLAQGMSTAPIQSWSQGAAKVANALVGALGQRRADAQEAEGRKGASEREKLLIAALSGGGGFTAPAASGASPGQDAIIETIINQESGGNPNAVSPKGATGLMQVMPATAADPGFGVQPIAPDKLTDPTENRRFGTEYYNAMSDRYDGNLPASLAAYNAGPGTADKFVAGGGDVSTLPAETQDYIAKITAALNGGGQPQSGMGGTPQMDQIMSVLNDPWATEGSRAVAQALIEQQMQSRDPAYRMGLEKSEIELRNLRNPKPDYGFTEVNGQIVRTDPTEGTAESVFTAPPVPDKPPAPDIRELNGRLVITENGVARDITPADLPAEFRPATPEERTSYGVAEGTPLVIGPNGEPKVLGDAEPKPTNDIQEYEYYSQQEIAAGRVPLPFAEFITSQKKAGATSISNVVGGESLTPGQKKIDEAFADEYVDWIGKGGFSDVDKQLGQLTDALAIIEKTPGITGPAIGMVPDYLQPFFNEEGVIAKNKVEEVVQRNLRAVLGAQFTEREGERLIARAYNPQLQPAENAKRVRALLIQIRSMAEAKQAAVDYFNENGSLRGFTGTRPSMAQLDEMMAPDTPPAAASSVAPGAAPPAGGVPVQITTEEEFNALPPGTEFIAPDGSRRRKP